jgi:hypothetical protein
MFQVASDLYGILYFAAFPIAQSANSSLDWMLKDVTGVRFGARAWRSGPMTAPPADKAGRFRPMEGPIVDSPKNVIAHDVFGGDGISSTTLRDSLRLF